MCTSHVTTFFFFQRVLSGFKWFQINPLEKLRKRRKRKRGCPEKLHGFENRLIELKISGWTNFRVGITNLLSFPPPPPPPPPLVFYVELRTYRQQQHLSLENSSSLKFIFHIIFSNAPPSPYILTYIFYRRKENYPRTCMQEQDT